MTAENSYTAKSIARVLDKIETEQKELRNEILDTTCIISLIFEKGNEVELGLRKLITDIMATLAPAAIKDSAGLKREWLSRDPWRKIPSELNTQDACVPHTRFPGVHTRFLSRSMKTM